MFDNRKKVADISDQETLHAKQSQNDLSVSQETVKSTTEALAHLNLPEGCTTQIREPSSNPATDNLKWDVCGLVSGSLCSFKCLLTGVFAALGSASVGLSSLLHLTHSPFILIPLVLLSAWAATKGLLIPLLKELNKVNQVKNPIMFYIGFASAGSLMFIISAQVFSGVTLSLLMNPANHLIGGDHLDHSKHIHDLNAIVYDNNGILGLEELTFIYLFKKLLHTFLFMTSGCLSLTHLFKIITTRKK